MFHNNEKKKSFIKDVQDDQDRRGGSAKRHSTGLAKFVIVHPTSYTIEPRMSAKHKNTLIAYVRVLISLSLSLSLSLFL